jgi:ankyrin repeat protein
LKIGLDINSIDQRKSSPLHWAAFAGAEHALQFVLAWGGNPNA